MGKTTQQYKAIEKVIQDYVEGTNGNVELLKENVFLPTALINGSPIAELYEIVKERGETHRLGRHSERRREPARAHRGLARHQLRRILPPRADAQGVADFVEERRRVRRSAILRPHGHG